MKKIILSIALVLISFTAFATTFPKTGTLYVDNGASDLEVGVSAAPNNQALLSFAQATMRPGQMNKKIGTFTMYDETTNLKLLFAVGELSKTGPQANNTALLTMQDGKNGGTKFSIQHNIFHINSHRYQVVVVIATENEIKISIHKS